MKKNIILLGGLMTCLALFATVSSAQQGTSSIKREIRASSTVEKQKLQNDLKQRSDEARSELAQKREEIRKEIEKNREEFRKEISDKKAEVKKIATIKRVELIDRLRIVKDEKKQQIVLSIGDQFQQINAKVLSNLTNILAKEEGIIQKISSRADVVTLQGGDVTALKESIVIANNALAKAREAIVAQTAKVYTIAVKTEAALKSDIGITKQSLEKDLSGVRDLVKAVHESVKDVAALFEKIPGAEKMKVLQVSSASSTNQ